MNISIYPQITDTKSNDVIPVDVFFDNIRNGFWQDLVLPIRAERDKAKRQELKKYIPSVTMSGIFHERKDNSCKSHSGFLALDFDDLYTQVEPLRQLLSHDPYVYAIFTSVSGTGLCVVLQIDGDRHRDAFYGAAEYMLKKYQQPIDIKCINESRPRYVSFDPHLFMNERAMIFKKYLPKEPKRPKITTIFVKKEFEDIIGQMIDRNVSCVDDYRDWLKVSFALADHLGEAGREYFHNLSRISQKYDTTMCDKQYDHAVNRAGTGRSGVTIATIYYFAKEAGISIQSETTKKVTRIAQDQKRAGLDPNTIIKNLLQFEGIQPEQSEGIVQQAFDYEQPDVKGTNIDSVLSWLKHSYSMRRNSISRHIELNGKNVEDADLNSIWIDAKRVFPEITYEIITRCIYSRSTDEYNPFMEWYKYHKEDSYSNEIMRLWACFKTDDPVKLADFGTRWLVGIISGIYGEPSPLYFILAGNTMGTGKTQFFRRLLPVSWKRYYVESKLDGNLADDLITMCKSVLIMNDEFDGKSKYEEKRFKALTDKDKIDVREPYGRASVEMRRLAALGGTSQVLELLNDPHGNRRIIPINVLGIDWAALNAIDRDALFAEVFRLYHAGYRWQVTGEDMLRLNRSTTAFLDYSSEYELINDAYTVPDSLNAPGAYWATATEVKVRIEAATGQRTVLQKIGQELQRIGFTQIIKKMNGKTCRVYWVTDRRRDLFDMNNIKRFDPDDFAPVFSVTPP